MIEKNILNMARKAMLDNIEALDKKTLQRELRKSLKKQFNLEDIINELEKDFEKTWLHFKDCESESLYSIAYENKCYLDKLKELKEEQCKKKV